jgi:type I restriction enzyme R subunit
LEELGYAAMYGPDLLPDGLFPERTDVASPLLDGRLLAALRYLNPTIPIDAFEDASRRVASSASVDPVDSNRVFHKMLTDGVDLEYQQAGSTVHRKAWLIDWHHPERNDWLAVNQFTLVERQNRRPDVVIFVNGLPLAVIELKNIGDVNATIRGAFNQFQTYKADIPSLFAYNEVLIISDGIHAHAGTISANYERFLPWRTIDGVGIAPPGSLELETLLRGVFDKARFLDLIRHFIVFEANGEGTQPVKKMAGYHQFWAVNKAVGSTVRASSAQGDRKAGVIWHTQGSGKSLSMVFYAGKMAIQPEMENPTLVVITDRNDLDEQLYGTFCGCQDLVRQTPERAQSREHLRQLLNRASGGIVFTTIQKFLPEDGASYPKLSSRRNIVVIADEAHRSQYGINAHMNQATGELSYGFAKHMRDALPLASFIGFTGTPVEQSDRSTPAIFGDYIDIYDIQRAVEDGATVSIFYEGRLARLELDEDEKPKIDPAFEEVTEGEEESARQRLRSKWAALEALVGADKRINLVAKDIVDHWDKRLQTMDGKAMIVCMSRRICVALYKALVELRPEWQSDDDNDGVLKVVMTGSSADPAEYQPHVKNGKARRERLAARFKDPDDPMKLVIVRDMWLTGFDAPCLHTMYVDKPMKGHGLMQAIARVNRVFRDKPGGHVVDYLGLADQLKQALSDYTRSGGSGAPSFDIQDAIDLMTAKYEVVKAMYHGFDYSAFATGTPAQRLQLIPKAMEHILAPKPEHANDEEQKKENKRRYLQEVTALVRAFALATPTDEAEAIRMEVAFFQTVRAAFVKNTSTDGLSKEDRDAAIQQIVSKAVASDEVIDLFGAAGLSKPDISILSDEFLEEVRQLPQRNLALEVMKKLLNDAIKARFQTNVVQSKAFSEMLAESIRRYQNRSIETAQVIAELIDLAKEMQKADQRGAALGLNDDEVAFYDAVATNESAVRELGDETLKQIARELVKTIRANVSIDWTMKETVRAKLRAAVKRLLRKYKYPPDKQDSATATVIEQAETLCKEWAD